MASGDSLFLLTAHGSIPTPSNYATLDKIADASTPPLTIPCLDFDGATDEHAEWYVVIPKHYSGATGFTFQYYYAMDGTDGNIVELEFRALHIDDQTVLTGNLGIDTQTETAIQDDPDATADDFNYSGTGTMAKANFGSAVAGDFLVIRCTRDESAVTNIDDLQLVAVYVTET